MIAFAIPRAIIVKVSLNSYITFTLTNFGKYAIIHWLQLICGNILVSQPAFTCSKLTIETLEQGVATGVVLVSLLLTLNIFHTLF